MIPYETKHVLIKCVIY